MSDSNATAKPSGSSQASQAGGIKVYLQIGDAPIQIVRLALDKVATAKKPRAASELIKRLSDLKELLDAGCLSQRDFSGLKTRLLNGD